MSRIRFDQLFKQYLEEFLTPLGRVQRNREIPGEPAFIDLWFEPTPAPEIQPNQLGLLGRLTHTASVIEPYHPPPTWTNFAVACSSCSTSRPKSSDRPTGMTAPSPNPNSPDCGY